MRPTNTSTRWSPTGSDSTWPPCPAAVGGVKPGSSAIGTTATGSPSCGGGGRPARAEDDGDVVLVDAGAVADGGCRVVRPPRPGSVTVRELSCAGHALSGAVRYC